MRSLSEHDFMSKKQKHFPKKAKRVDRTVIRRSIADINMSLDGDDCDVKSVTRKNVSLSADDETSLKKSRPKKLGKRRSSMSYWDVTELSCVPHQPNEKPAVVTQNIGSVREKRKVPPVLNDIVGDESIGTGKKEKLSRKKQKKHKNSAKKTNPEREGEAVEGDTTIEPNNQQSAVEEAPVTREEVEKAARALLKLIKVTAVKRGRSLFESEADCVHMQISSIRIPRTPTRRVRFSLPHPLVTETSDVCLFVPDLKKGPRIDHEPTIAHYRELLDQHGVKQITQIMPVRQLKDEYYQFEMRRRLCGSYDFFLADGRICGPINPLLGKAFHVTRKLPTPVNLHSKNLTIAIAKALSKTALTVTPRGDTTLVKIGLSHHSAEQLTENIMSAIKELKTRFPGGWHNIRSLSLKTDKSLRVPFYVTMKSANSVEIPVEKPRRPKAAVPVEDELSTIPGARVVVLPSGEIIVKKEANSEDYASEEESEFQGDSTCRLPLNAPPQFRESKYTFSMDSEQVFNIKLVEEIEKHPALYDYTCNDYSRKDATDKAWSEVSKEFGMTVADCKERWKNLSGAFVRLLKPDLSGSASQEKKLCYLVEARQFSLPFIKALKASSGNLPDVPHQGRDTDIIDAVNEESVIEQNSSIATLLPSLVDIGDSEDSFIGRNSLAATLSPSPLPNPPPVKLEQGSWSEPHTVSKKKCVIQKDAVENSFPEYLQDKKRRLGVTNNITIPKSDALKMFLLSMLPDLESMTEGRVRQFKRRCLETIDELLMPPLNPIYNSSSTISAKWEM